MNRNGIEIARRSRMQMEKYRSESGGRKEDGGDDENGEG